LDEILLFPVGANPASVASKRSGRWGSDPDLIDAEGAFFL
jgi:hypothetical protein